MRTPTFTESWHVLRDEGWTLSQLAGSLRAHAEEIGINHHVSMDTLKSWLYRDTYTPPVWAARKAAELARQRRQ